MEKYKDGQQKLLADKMEENVKRWNEEALNKSKEQGEEVSSNEITYTDVSKHLNVVNSKLGHVLPTYSDSDVVVTYNKMDYSRFNDYNKKMSQLKNQFDSLVANADMYKEEYIIQKLADIQEQADIHEKLAIMELETQYKSVIENPNVMEKALTMTDKAISASNRATTLTLTQAVLATDDVDMIHALLEDNISNSDVRLLAKIKINNLRKAENGTVDTAKLGSMYNAIHDYENKLKAKSALGVLEEQYENTRYIFKRVENKKGQYISKVIDLNNWDKNEALFTVWDFSLFNLKKQAKNKK